MARVPIAPLLAAFIVGLLLADRLELSATAALAAGVCGLLVALRPGRLVPLCGEALLAASLGALCLSLRIHASVPEPGDGPVAVTVVGSPRITPFGCTLLVQVHGPRPGRALVRGPEETCGWLPGQLALAHLELAPLRPATNPGERDSIRRWRRRGVRRVGRIHESRVARVGNPPTSWVASVEGWRRSVADAADPGAPTPQGAILRALVTGDRSRLSEDTWQPFQRSGTAHLLVVSGLHIGWAFALGRLAGLALLYPWASVRLQRGRRRAAGAAGLVAASIYAAMAGLSTPTLRAAAVAAAGTFAVLGGRPGAPWNALAFAAIVVGILEPAALFEPSAHLSFLAVLGILVWRPEGGPLRRVLGASLGASLATGPVLGALDLPLPVLAPVANLLLVPWFAGGVLPLSGLAVGATLLAPPVGAVLLRLARAAVTMGVRAAEGLQSPDLLHLGVGPVGCIAIGGALLALRAAARGAPALALSVIALSALAALMALNAGRGEARIVDPEVVFLDVGQGDATLVHLEGKTWLVDAGPASLVSDAGRRVVVPALRALGIDRLDALVLTHADRDHVGGAPHVLNRLHVGEIWINSATLDDPAFRAIRRLAAVRGVPLRLLSAGEATSVQEWRVEVLWPPRGSGSLRRNDAALVLRIAGPGGCVLLPSDAPMGVERRLAPDIPPCAFLKLGHHGSGTSSSTLWLAALDPELAFASAAPSRADRFPAPEIRERLERHRITLWETSRWGAQRLRLGPGTPVLVPHRLEPLPIPRTSMEDSFAALQGGRKPDEYPDRSTRGQRGNGQADAVLAGSAPAR